MITSYVNFENFWNFEIKILKIHEFNIVNFENFWNFEIKILKIHEFNKRGYHIREQILMVFGTSNFSSFWLKYKRLSGSSKIFTQKIRKKLRMKK